MPNTTPRPRLERVPVATFCGFDAISTLTTCDVMLSADSVERAMTFSLSEREDTAKFLKLPYVQRCMKSLLMLAQRKALDKRVDHVKYEHNNHATIVTYPCTQSEYREAQLTLDRFSNALGRGLLHNDDTRYADRRAWMLRNMTVGMFRLIDHARNTVNSIETPYGTTQEGRDVRTNVRDYLRQLQLCLYEQIVEVIDDACSVVDNGYFRLRYELDHGKLGSYHTITGSWDSISPRELNRIVGECLAFSEGHDECYDTLHDAGFYQCPDCGAWEEEEHTARTWDDDEVCRVCVDRRYVYSEYHECYVHHDDAVSALNRHGDEITIHQDCDDFTYDDDEETYVHMHYEKRGNVLRRYHSSKHDNAFRLVHSAWSQENERYFGIELEVECRKGRPYQHAERLNEVLNDGTLGQRCMFEEDGSLSNGFEIITQPMGLDTHYQFWEWLNVKQNIADLRSHDTSTCGLHIHVNRNNINTMQLNKLAVFVHAPDNSNLIRAIARRYGVGYASMHTKKLGTAHRESRSDPRYEAINMTGRNTIEFRLFKGTLKMQSLLAALEFTNALLRFTAPASEAGFILTASKFLDYINSSEVKQDTRNLRTYLDKVGFTISA